MKGRIWGAIAAVAGIGLALAMRAFVRPDPAYAEYPDTQYAWRGRSGFQIVPIVSGPFTPLNRMATAVGGRCWQFDISLPTDKRWLSFNIEVRAKNRPTQKMGGIAIGPCNGGQTRLICLLEPIGYTLAKAEKIKVAFSLTGASGATIFTNPFRKMIAGSAATGIRQADGTWLMMEGGKGAFAILGYPGNTMADNDVSVVARIETDTKP